MMNFIFVLFGDTKLANHGAPNIYKTNKVNYFIVLCRASRLQELRQERQKTAKERRQALESKQREKWKTSSHLECAQGIMDCVFISIVMFFRAVKLRAWYEMVILKDMLRRAKMPCQRAICLSQTLPRTSLSQKRSPFFFCETDPIFCLEMEMEMESVYPRNTLRALWSSFNMRPCIPDRIGIWQCWFLRRGENRST